MYQHHSYEFNKFQQYALIFFFHVQYLSELHCSQKWFKGINSYLFIKNYINYIHICIFNICKCLYTERNEDNTYLLV